MIGALVGELDGPDLDHRLLERLFSAGLPYADRVLHAAAPSFRSYAADDFPCQGAAAFPAFSITGAACALGCAHCGGRILGPMRPAVRPEVLEAEVRRLAARGSFRGFLLSGGSNRRNEVRFDAFLPVVERLKREFPEIEIAVHTGLVDERRAAALAAAGVDVAMLDIIGDADTIREVYRLDRPVGDFEASLAHLVAAGLRVVPHVVAGLHFGRIRGEMAALEIIARHATPAAILVVVMPHLTEPDFAAIDPTEVAEVFAIARQKLADRMVLLGCGRPVGRVRTLLDLYALAAGFDGIAHPAQGVLTVARAMGRKIAASPRCCGL